MNAKSDYWWKLQSLWISYFWFDHLDALQIKKTRVIARNATHQGGGILQHFFPFRLLHESSFSLFFFKALVHEESIWYLSPADSAATFDQQQSKKGHFCFLSATRVLCLCVCARKRTSVRERVSASVSESKRLWLTGNQSFRVWKSEDGPDWTYSDPF